MIKFLLNHFFIYFFLKNQSSPKFANMFYERNERWSTRSGRGIERNKKLYNRNANKFQHWTT